MNALLQEGLMATKNIKHAAIIRKKDLSIKAKSHQFSITPTELMALEHAFEKPSDIRGQDAFFGFMDTPYKAIRADKQSIYGKNDKNGLVIAKTAHHYIFGTFDSTMYGSVAIEAVEKLAEYLRKKDK